LPCQVYDGKCVLLSSFKSPDLYFDFLKKCSALYLKTGKFELLGMHALVHLSGPNQAEQVCQHVFGTDCTFEEAVYKNRKY
jgi:hypothetical protein